MATHNNFIQKLDKISRFLSYRFYVGYKICQNKSIRLVSSFFAGFVYYFLVVDVDELPKSLNQSASKSPAFFSYFFYYFFSYFFFGYLSSKLKSLKKLSLINSILKIWVFSFLRIWAYIYLYLFSFLEWKVNFITEFLF